MKRALAIAVAVCTLGVAGFGITLSGTWAADVDLLPAVSIESTLTLNYTVAGFTITGVSRFAPAGLDWMRFSLAGPFGPLTLAGSMWFQATPPAYESSHIAATLDFGGIAIGTIVRHWVAGEWRAAWTADPLGGAAGMQYIFTTTVAPVTLRTEFLDPTDGIRFHRLDLDVKDIPLCCGITFDAALDFVREGFEDITISGFGIPFIAGVTMDISILYSVQTKSVTITPRLPGLGVACISVWGRPQVDRDLGPRKLTGVQLDLSLIHI